MNAMIDCIKRRFFTPETFCGLGSYLKNTKEASAFIIQTIRDHKIKSIIDIGCGDMHWLANVSLHDENIEKYTGIDSDSEMLSLAMGNTQTPNYRLIYQFMKADVRMISSLPKNDLIICRDLLIHLGNDDIHRLIEIFIKSGTKWMMANTYDIGRNYDLDGNQEYTKRIRPSRKINLFISPYYLPPAKENIRELNCSRDRILCLWDLDDLRGLDKSNG